MNIYNKPIANLSLTLETFAYSLPVVFFAYYFIPLNCFLSWPIVSCALEPPGKYNDFQL